MRYARRLLELTQVYIATHPGEVGCPRCRVRSSFWIPDNGIGLVCQWCGAWSIVHTPLPRFMAPAVAP